MIAIHVKSGAFTKEWVKYCVVNQIPFKEVDCFQDDIIEQLRDCDLLLWHWSHNDHKAQLFARQLTSSVEQSGMLVFPNYKTCWHYDDKLGQKYLLESIKAPFIPTHVFYNKSTALSWSANTELPVVWKLRGGAGSQNVKLLKTREQLRRVTIRSFRRGWKPSRWYALKEKIWKFSRDKSWKTFSEISRGIYRVLFPNNANFLAPIQRNYVYFQKFIPGNTFDIRVVIIGDRAFALKRSVRKGDFRASGSGKFQYDRSQIPLKCIELGFKVATELCVQCCAFDFVYDGSEWLIVEVSYAFSPDAYRQCDGVWNKDLDWRAEKVMPEVFIMEDMLSEIEAIS